MAMAGTFDRKTFFDKVRAPLFGNRLDGDQVNGIEFLLSEIEKKNWTDKRWAAYALATVYHETARTMLPIKERGGNDYFFRMYDKDGSRPAVAARLGNTTAGDGIKYAGRGFVQITGRSNYTDWERRLGLPLVNQPDLALEPDVAAVILLEGMALGTFTGRKLPDYFSTAVSDPVNARRIVNGVDKAEEIARHYVVFLDALQIETPVYIEEPVVVSPSLEDRVAALEQALERMRKALNDGV